MPAQSKCTSLAVVLTYDDGTTATVVVPEPASFQVEDEVLQQGGDVFANSLYAFDNSRIRRTLTFVTGERGIVVIVTPRPGP